MTTYAETLWENGEDPSHPPINRTNLRKVETGVRLAHEEIEDARQFVNESRNVILTGGGTITWGVVGQYRLAWNERFILLPVSAEVSPDGFVNIEVPSSLIGPDSQERNDGSGLLIHPWEALVFTHTRGVGSSSGNAVRIISYDPSAQSGLLDSETAYILAVHNSETENLTFRNGLTLAHNSTSVGGVPPGGEGGGGGSTDLTPVYDFVNEARNTPTIISGSVEWGVSSQRLRWDGVIHLIPTSTALSSAEWVGFVYPSGPVLDGNDVDRRTADGIQILDWECLWARKTRGSDGSTGISYHVRYHNDSALFAQEDAFLIAVRNGDNDYLWVRNGMIMRHGETNVGGAASASSVAYSGSTNTAAGNVEGALDELDAEKVKRSGDTMNGNLGFNSQLQAGQNRPGPRYGFEFLLASDQAALYAQELGTDNTDYVFQLSDNIDAGSVDRFVFGGNSWMQRVNPEAGQKPLLNALELWGMDRMILNTHMHMNGWLNLRTARLLEFKMPSGTTADTFTYPTVVRNGQVTSNVNLNGSTLTMTANPSGYTGTHPRYYRVTIDGTGSPNTFKWAAMAGAETAGIAVGAGPITLDQGVTVSFNGTSGGVLNETFEFWVLPAGRLQHNDVDIVKPDGMINLAKLGTGTRDATTVLYGNGTFAPPPAGGEGGASTASAVSYGGSANLSSTTVEAALDELDAEKERVTPAATPATTSRTLLTTEEYVRASGTITLTLPDASVAHPRGYIIHNVGTGRIDVVAASGDNINGLASIWTDTQNDVVQIRPGDANSWGITVPAGGMDTGGAVSVAPGTGITSATLASGSNARAGRVTLVNGGALITNALIFTLTLALGAAPKGVFIKGGNVAGARVDWNVFGDFSTLSATTAQIRIVDDGLVASTTYEFYYQIVG